MISYNNHPENISHSNNDFTVNNYRKYVQLALKSYRPSEYSNIPWGQNFILWRHDCDLSLNRAKILSQIEKEEGLKATYFINLHSEFYNLFELNQFQIIQEIIGNGHSLGIHFDAKFYDVKNENELEEMLLREKEILQSFFKVKIRAFSFHNPSAKELLFEKETYAELINCYSKKFKEEVPYCSDSNGYWRFRRLETVLEESKDKCLQILTHPGWWVDEEMFPRERVLRAIYGRAKNTIDYYNSLFDGVSRRNLSDIEIQIDKKYLEEHELKDYYYFLTYKKQYKLLFDILKSYCISNKITIEDHGNNSNKKTGEINQYKELCRNLIEKLNSKK